MSSIYDVVTPKALKTEWEESEQDREPFLLEGFFNDVKQLGTELSRLQGNAPKTRPLDLSAYDVKALPLSREAFGKINLELPYFKNFLPINEKMRQDLLVALQTGNQQYIDTLLNRIYNDNKTLLEDARVTREMMRAMIMTTGSIAFSSNGQAVAYDFGVPSTHKKTISESASKWSASSTADPIKDITDWQNEILQETGVKPTNLLMNQKTFNMLKNCDKVKNTIYVLGDAKVQPNERRVKEFVLDETGCTIYIYDKGYFAQGSNTLTKFIPDNVVSLFPDKVLGDFTFGTTPAEADLMSGTNTEVEIVDLGVALTREKLVDPVYSKLIVSMTGCPVLDVPNEIVIATVA